MENILLTAVTILVVTAGAIITSRMDANDRRAKKVRARQALALRNYSRLDARRAEL